MDDRLPDNEKDSLMIQKRVKMERIRQLAVKGTDPSFPGYVMEEYMTMEENEEYRRLNREVNKMKKRIEVLEDEEFEQRNRPAITDEEAKRIRRRIRMERRLDKDMKAVVPPPFKYFMTGITDPLNATFTGVEDDSEGEDSDTEVVPEPITRTRRKSTLFGEVLNSAMKAPFAKSPGRTASRATEI